MSKILYIKKKIGKSYLVWFQNSNLYFKLEEPGWYVLSQTVKRHKTETIAKRFSTRYDLPYKKSLNFVVEMRKKINSFNQFYRNNKYIEGANNNLNEYDYNSYSSYIYNMQNSVIKFTYETPWLEKFIHPLVRHLTTTEVLNEKHHFELFIKNDEIVFRLDNRIKGIWTKNETEYVKGRIFIEMINVLFHKSENDWLMSVHASAVTNGTKTILFSADQGSGKTTFAALLLAHGYQVISDDFVPIEQSTFKAYPFPIALSVKEGALKLISSHFPELKQNQLIRVNSEKNVKYLPVDTKIMEMIFPVKEIVFIKYDKTIDFQLEKVETVTGIQKLLNEAWIPAIPENVEIFLNSILNISFYNLTYSNNEMAMKAVTQLFENDAY